MARVSKTFLSLILLTQLIACSSGLKNKANLKQPATVDSKEFDSAAEKKHFGLIRRYGR